MRKYNITISFADNADMTQAKFYNVPCRTLDGVTKWANTVAEQLGLEIADLEWSVCGA